MFLYVTRRWARMTILFTLNKTKLTQYLRNLYPPVGDWRFMRGHRVVWLCWRCVIYKLYFWCGLVASGCMSWVVELTSGGSEAVNRVAGDCTAAASALGTRSTTIVLPVYYWTHTYICCLPYNLINVCIAQTFFTLLLSSHQLNFRGSYSHNIYCFCYLLRQ